MRLVVRTVGTVLVLVSMTCCTKPASSSAPTVPTAIVPGVLSDLTWLSDETVLVLTVDSSHDSRQIRSIVNSASGQVDPISPDLGPADCQDPSKAVMTTSGDNASSISLGVLCSGFSSTFDINVLVSFDDESLQHGHRTLEFHASDQYGGKALAPHPISSGGDWTVIAAGSSVCGDLWSSSGGAPLTPIDLTVDEVAWSNVESAKRRLTDFTAPCPDQLLPYAVALSRDGQQLAFLAAPTGNGMSVAQAAGAPADLYVAASSGGPARRVARQLGDANYLRWSPAGDAVAIGTNKGTYLVETNGHETNLRPDNCAVSWSPDGTQIAVACDAGDQAGRHTSVYFEPSPR